MKTPWVAAKEFTVSVIVIFGAEKQVAVAQKEKAQREPRLA
ncbi:hypothetical protein RSK20926_06912 [Roseobacter sp. SK209-2-6]|nr:hypothetical protein RSK20926_06912 [Roseobacter sp. SK209-2-6]